MNTKISITLWHLLVGTFILGVSVGISLIKL